MERHRCWVILARVAEVTSASHSDWANPPSPGVQRKEMLSCIRWLDRDFICCPMKLTLFYLCATSVRAFDVKRQFTSKHAAFAKKAPPQPSQYVPLQGDRRKNVRGGGRHVISESVSVLKWAVWDNTRNYNSYCLRTNTFQLLLPVQFLYRCWNPQA